MPFTRSCVARHLQNGDGVCEGRLELNASVVAFSNSGHMTGYSELVVEEL
jgi:hypothetical protein